MMPSKDVTKGTAERKDLARPDPEVMQVFGSIDNLMLSQMQCPSIVDLLNGRFYQTNMRLLSRQHPDSLGFDPSSAIQELELDQERFLQQARYFSKLSTLHRYAGDPKQANELAARAAVYSDDPFYKHKLIEASVLNGNLTYAVEQLKELVSKGDEQAQIKLASWHLVHNELLQCRSILTDILRNNPLSFRGRFLAGTVSLIDGEYGQAVHHYRVCTSNRPWHADSYFNLAIAHALNNHPNKAYEALRRSVATAPMNPKIITAFSELSYELNQHKHAIKVLHRYLHAFSDAYDLWEKLAAHCYRAADFQMSKAALQQQAKGGPTTAIYNNLGCNESALGNTKAAKMHWINAVSLNKGDYDFFLAANNLIGALFREQDWQEIIVLGQSLIDHPNHAIIGEHEVLSDIYFNTYYAYSETDRFSTGFTLLEELADLAEDDGYRLMSMCYLASVSMLEPNQADYAAGIVDECLKRYQHIGADLSKSLDHAIVNNLCFSLLELGRIDAAEPLVKRLDMYIGKGAYVTATKGLYYWKIGNVTKGVDFYRRAMSLAPSRYTHTLLRQKLTLEIGRGAAASGEKRRASQLFNKILKLRRGSKQMARMAQYELTRLY